MSIQELISYSEKIDLYPISLEEFAASENFYKLYRFPECKLTFIYNKVACSVAIYDGKETDSLILECHTTSKLSLYLYPEYVKLIDFIIEKHQG